MPTCPSCGAELSPEWKFCIRCGAATRAPSSGMPTVPGAIRPDAGTAIATPSRLDVPLLVGIVLGTAGVALIVYIGILLLGPG